MRLGLSRPASAGGRALPRADVNMPKSSPLPRHAPRARPGFAPGLLLRQKKKNKNPASSCSETSPNSASIQSARPLSCGAIRRIPCEEKRRLFLPW